MNTKIELAQPLIDEGRRLYEETLTPVLEVCKRMGLSRAAFYARVHAWQWKRRRYIAGDLAAESAPPQAAEPAPPEPDDEPFTPERRALLHERALRAAELRMAKIERILLMLNPQNEAQAERAARVISSTDRPLRQIVSLTAPDAAGPKDDSAQDQVPRDLDTLRDELARRINAFVDARRDERRAGDRGEHKRLETGGD
ncbi:MAG TPA: hypothetical protein VFP74_09695 [Pseudolabrys sp.]|jgi:hypothetical protein|nr:hypothetical protein [Pseudolabrys sp.]